MLACGSGALASNSLRTRMDVTTVRSLSGPNRRLEVRRALKRVVAYDPAIPIDRAIQEEKDRGFAHGFRWMVARMDRTADPTMVRSRGGAWIGRASRSCDERVIPAWVDTNQIDEIDLCKRGFRMVARQVRRFA